MSTDRELLERTIVLLRLGCGDRHQLLIDIDAHLKSQHSTATLSNVTITGGGPGGDVVIKAQDGPKGASLVIKGGTIRGGEA